MTLESRISSLEVRVDGLEDSIRRMRTRIEGPPREESLSGRVHKLENDASAARAAAAAIRGAEMLREQHDDRSFSRKERLLALALALVIVICTVATTVVVFSGRG